MVGTLLKLGWRNIWRNRRRTMFTLLALTVGVMCLVFIRSFLAGVIDNASEAIIKTQTGHIRITRSAYLKQERIMPKEHLVTGIQQIETALATRQNIELQRVNQRINFNILANHGTMNETVLAVGINPQATDETMNLSKAIVAGHYFNPTKPSLKLLIGKPLAKQLQVSVGSELLLITTDINYSTYALPFIVAGIFETGMGMQDKHVIYIPLSKAQEMLDCQDSAHELLLFIKNPKDAVAVAHQVEKILAGPGMQKQGELSVVPWQKSELLGNILPLMENIYGKVLGIIMLIVALVILNTMLMAVMERYHEIGVMKAMGFKNREVFSMILTEAFYIGVIGSSLGGILGGIISAILEKTGIDLTKINGQDLMSKIDMPIPFLGKILYPDFSFAILGGSLVFGLVIAMLAVLYPAFKSAKMLPVEAFRSQLKL